jgi:hypothetical protein
MSHMLSLMPTGARVSCWLLRGWLFGAQVVVLHWRQVRAGEEPTWGGFSREALRGWRVYLQVCTAARAPLLLHARRALRPGQPVRQQCGAASATWLVRHQQGNRPMACSTATPHILTLAC